MLNEPSIPGQTPLDDLSGLKRRDIRTRQQLDAAEAENIRKAVLKYLAARPHRRAVPFDRRWAVRLHGEMFGEVWTWAGVLRVRELNLGVPAHQAGVSLQNLFDDLRSWKESGMPLIEQATRLHHRAVSIHPFLNGNGRWARLLSNIWLKVEGSEPVEWPETVIGSASAIRGEYLRAVCAADAGDLLALLGLHRRYQPAHPD